MCVIVFNFAMKVVLETSKMRRKQWFCIIVKSLIIYFEISLMFLKLCHVML